MAETDRFVVSKAIREVSGERPYIIAISAYALQESKEHCLQAGMNGFLSKPIRLPELIEAVKCCPAPANNAIDT